MPCPCEFAQAHMNKKEREHCAEKYKITRDKEAMKIT
jgi:hypothetical protein